MSTHKDLLHVDWNQAITRENRLTRFINSKNTRGSTNEQPSANENSSHPQHNMTDHNNDKGSRASSPDDDSNTDVNEQPSTNM